jgi:hypothetical protein
VQGLGRGDGGGGVAAAGLAEVGDDPAAEPAVLDPGADGVDPAGHLPPGGHGEVGQRERPAALAAADHRVEQVDAGGLHRDPDLAGAGRGIRDRLVLERRGRPEGVLADGMHASLLVGGSQRP